MVALLVVEVGLSGLVLGVVEDNDETVVAVVVGRDATTDGATERRKRWDDFCCVCACVCSCICDCC